ncbi:MAG: hypothetical protein GY851_00970 [bacterium]|nr:hypothetical protein [bacterium]
MPSWETIKRGANEADRPLALVGFFALVVYGFMAACGSESRLMQCVGGFYLSGVLWLAGSYAARRLAAGEDGALWHLTPLTPRLLLQQALRNSVVMLFVVIVVLSAALVAIHLLFRHNSPEGGTPHVLLITTLLFYAVCFTVPLCEHVSGKRRVTGLVFAMRHLVRYMGIAALFVLGALSIAMVIWEPVWGLFAAMIDAVLGWGVIAYVLVFIVSPMSGIALAHGDPGFAWLVWGFVTFLIGILVWSVRGVVHATRPLPPVQMGRTHYARWLTNAWGKVWERRGNPRGATGDTVPAGDEAKPTVPYDETRSPEHQLIRHCEPWRRIADSGGAGLGARVRAWVQRHRWLTIVWVLWMVSAALHAIQLPIANLVGFLFVSAIPTVASESAVRIRHSMTMTVLLPLRWERLAPHAFLYTVRRFILPDLLFSTLVGTVALTRPDVWLVAILLATLIVIRAVGLLLQWLQAMRRAGRWWLPWVNVGMYIIGFVGSVVLLDQLLGWAGPLDPDIFNLGRILALIVLWMVLIELLVAVILTLFVSRRDGSSVPGYVAPLKEDA